VPNTDRLILLLRVVFLGNLLFSVALALHILGSYAKRAFRGGDIESRWLGRHITAIASSHLLLLAWTTGRFFVTGSTWHWLWVAALVAIFGLSDFALVQMYVYRRWRDGRSASALTKK
jgi:hypothetical protein